MSTVPPDRAPSTGPDRTAAPPAVERTLTLTARERTLSLEAVGTDGATAHIIAVERDAAGKVLSFGRAAASDTQLVPRDGYVLFRLDSCSFSLTSKGCARVQAWRAQLQGTP